MDAVLVRYGELFLKSESVKRYFIRILLENMRKALDSEDLGYRIEDYRGRILIRGDNLEAIAQTVSRLFGVVGVSICAWTRPDRMEIEETAVRLALKRLKPGMSYAVRARRSGMVGFTSQELGASIGSKILDHIPDLQVDLKHPRYEIFVEARDIGGLIYDDRIDGPGGLPYGTQGKVLSLLSAGIDSPVASWLVMRRGARVDFLHCAGGRWMGDDVWKGVVDHVRVLSGWVPGVPLSLSVVDIEPFYDALVEHASVRNRCIICKRFMMRIGARLAEEREIRALVTGESIGQVASQTLENLAVIEAVVPAEVPVLRPLITYDKQETVDLARRIGTFSESQGDLGCRAVPKHPAIAGEYESVQRDEKKMDIEHLVQLVCEHARYYPVKSGKIEEISLP
jgi:thiamine biosynthesis protein ThiI